MHPNGCTTFLLLPAAFRLFLWSRTASEFQIILYFLIASVLLAHTEPCLLLQVCLAVFLSRICIQQTKSFFTSAITYIVSYVGTAAYIFIEGRMRPCGRSLCTPALE